MVNDTFIGARAGSWRQEKILQPSMATFLFSWILQNLWTTFPASRQAWVCGRVMLFQAWMAHHELGEIWTPWYAEVIETSLLMPLAPGFPQRSEFSSHSKLIVSSSIYSVKAEVCEFWPSPARFGVFLITFLFKIVFIFKRGRQKKSIAYRK